METRAFGALLSEHLKQTASVSAGIHDTQNLLGFLKFIYDVTVREFFSEAYLDALEKVVQSLRIGASSVNFVLG